MKEQKYILIYVEYRCSKSSKPFQQSSTDFESIAIALVTSEQKREISYKTRHNGILLELWKSAYLDQNTSTGSITSNDGEAYSEKDLAETCRNIW